MVEHTPRIPASADSMAARLGETARSMDLIDVIDLATASLRKVEVILIAIDELDLGVGGNRFELLCTLRDIGAQDVAEALMALRAIDTRSAVA